MSADLRAPPSRALGPLYGAELLGTALLVFGGVSWVTVMFSPHSPLPALLPDAGLRRALTGALFGLTGTAVTLSPLGRLSGAHLNPAVTFAFWLERQIGPGNAVLYVGAQLLGGVLGAAALLVWGRWGRAVAFGVTRPAPGVSAALACALEAAITFALVTVIFVLLAHGRTRSWTPWSIPPLFSLLVWLEAPLTGTSANPARSLGPALVTGTWTDAWVYAVGPLVGAGAAVSLIALEVWGTRRIREARLAHFRAPIGLDERG